MLEIHGRLSAAAKAAGLSPALDAKTAVVGVVAVDDVSVPAREVLRRLAVLKCEIETSENAVATTKGKASALNETALRLADAIVELAASSNAAEETLRSLALERDTLQVQLELQEQTRGDQLVNSDLERIQRDVDQLKSELTLAELF